MKKNQKMENWIYGILILFLSILAYSPAMALTITSLPGIEGLGSFEGSFEFTATNNTSATVNVSLTNTSPEFNGGFLTAFAFNNPKNKITSATLSSKPSGFSILGLGDNSIPGDPMGDFDLGSASTNSWLGGGSPNNGIAVGSTGDFTFDLIGTDFLSLSVADFIFERSVDSPSDQAQWFAARFRGFLDGGSDKVGADNPPGVDPIPEPGTMILLGFGLIGLAGIGRRKIKK